MVTDYKQPIEKTNKVGVLPYLLIMNSSVQLLKMSTKIEHIIEITLEIWYDKMNITTVSCIYRTPGSCFDTFSVKLVNIHHQITDEIYICVWGF